MSSIFVDRESAYPNRYRVIPENGDAYYVIMERADEAVTPGTPLNAETFNRMRDEITADIGSVVLIATDPNNDGNVVLKYGGTVEGGGEGGSIPSIGGGLTAEEVQAMIDAALGVIENGTY